LAPGIALALSSNTQIKNLFLLKKIDTNAIQWALAHQSCSGRSTETFSDASYLYLPIKVGNNSLGVIGVWLLKDSLTMDDSRIAQLLVDQAALAIERLNYASAQNKK
jgi:K+-sensing histidine kinase KdpD